MSWPVSLGSWGALIIPWVSFIFGSSGPYISWFLRNSGQFLGKSHSASWGALIMTWEGLIYKVSCELSGFSIIPTLRNANKYSNTKAARTYQSCITASGSVFHQLLAATRRRRKSPNLSLWAQAFTSINQATLSAGAHFSQPSNIEQHMAWDLFLLPASTADSTLLPHTKDKWTHIPLHPFWAWYPLMHPHGLDMAI